MAVSLVYDMAIVMLEMPLERRVKHWIIVIG